VAKKKKRKGRASPISAEVEGLEDEVVSLPAAPARISRPFAEALKGKTVAKPVAKPGAAATSRTTGLSRSPMTMPPVDPPLERVGPPERLRREDERALRDALSGVKPLGGRPARRVTRTDRPTLPIVSPARLEGLPDPDDAARARLATLVAGGIRFQIERDDETVAGARAGSAQALLKRLKRGDPAPETSIDLHGMTADEAEREVVKVLRTSRQRGARALRIVHGKGLHSEGGKGVLADRIVRLLTEGAGAPFVEAFATAPARFGGTGALLVVLAR